MLHILNEKSLTICNTGILIKGWTFFGTDTVTPVSYTHLDVYKRQPLSRSLSLSLSLTHTHTPTVSLSLFISLNYSIVLPCFAFSSCSALLLIINILMLFNKLLSRQNVDETCTYAENAEHVSEEGL